MFREYQDTRIQRNLKVVKILSLIALILVILSAIAYLFAKWIPFEYMKTHPEEITLSYIRCFWGGEDFWINLLDVNASTNWILQISWDFIYCFGYFDLAWFIFLLSKGAMRKAGILKKSDKPDGEHVDTAEQLTFPKGRIKGYLLKQTQKLSMETRCNNDFSATLICVVFNLIPFVIFFFLLLAAIIASIAGTYEDIAGDVMVVSYHLGGMLLPYILLIISCGFLIQNCVLIKREWKTNPPQFIIEEQQKAEAEAQKQKIEQDVATCKALLEECGMQFFIEYYPQIKRLPLRDVTVSDRYLSEREVRLTAAKKIVNSDLSGYAFQYIIGAYSDILPSDAIERAKTLLNDIENNKGESK